MCCAPSPIWISRVPAAGSVNNSAYCPAPPPCPQSTAFPALRLPSAFLRLEVWGTNFQPGKVLSPSLWVGVQAPVLQPGVLRGMILKSSPHWNSEFPSRIKPGLLTGSSSCTLSHVLPEHQLPSITSWKFWPPRPSGTTFRETQTEMLIPCVCKSSKFLIEHWSEYWKECIDFCSDFQFYPRFWNVLKTM